MWSVSHKTSEICITLQNQLCSVSGCWLSYSLAKKNTCVSSTLVRLLISSKSHLGSLFKSYFQKLYILSGRQKETCPLSGICQIEGVVYQATVTREDNGEEKTYVGLTESTFKIRYHNHASSFRNPKRKHATELSKYIWNLKESDVRYSTKWKIIKQCRPYFNKTKRCNLCLYEKFIIICHPELSSLKQICSD